MITVKQDIIEPVAGCSPAGGLSQRQGRRAEPQHHPVGAGKDSGRAAVPGNSKPESLPVRKSFPVCNMKLTVLSARRAVAEMHRLLLGHSKDVSMRQCWIDCASIENDLRAIKAEIDRLTRDNLPLCQPGYMDIPA